MNRSSIMVLSSFRGADEPSHEDDGTEPMGRACRGPKKVPNRAS